MSIGEDPAIGMGWKAPATAEELRLWLVGTVAPLWARNVANPARAGYAEYLDHEGIPVPQKERTTLVTARLVYSFSHLYLLGAPDEVLRAAEHGFEFLSRHCQDPADGGFWHSVSSGGSPIGGWKDSYDQAFVLFATAWFHRATGSMAALDLADRVADFMDRQLVDPEFGGYLERVPADAKAAPFRRQNPHMHLLEAYHALYEATGSPRWSERAQAIVELFLRHFFDRETGTLIEYFAGDWGAAAGVPGQLREPGHHFEWGWLLLHHHRILGDKRVIEPARRLLAFADRRGIDRLPGFVSAAHDEVDAQGAVLKASKLFWPQTEALKASLARAEVLGEASAMAEARERLAVLFRHYILGGDGRWRNRIARDGSPLPDELPTRVFYHFVLALAEFLRVERQVSRPAVTMERTS